MKTLDEVIWEAPYSQTPWEADALHYLKEYKKKLNILEVRMTEYKRGFEQLGAEWSRIKENPPLTWDELKQMKEKPVWVEVDGKWWGRFWAFVEVENDSYINFFKKGQEYPEDLWKRDMGKTWNAFRKERK